MVAVFCQSLPAGEEEEEDEEKTRACLVTTDVGFACPSRLSVVTAREGLPCHAESVGEGEAERVAPFSSCCCRSRFCFPPPPPRSFFPLLLTPFSRLVVPLRCNGAPHVLESEASFPSLQTGRSQYERYRLYCAIAGMKRAGSRRSMASFTGSGLAFHRSPLLGARLGFCLRGGKKKYVRRLQSCA